MAFKSSLAITTGKLSYWFLHKFLNGGTSLPGKLTLALDPDVLTPLARDYEIIIITGTNGKTLTTALTTKALRAKYPDLLTNPSGSNMKQGIVTAFLTHQVTGSGKKLAVLETDEANVPLICKYIKPTMFVLTNLFRDQMDRYGEIATTYRKILAGIKQHPDAIVLANGDAPIFNSEHLANKVYYYGFNPATKRPATPSAAPANTDNLLCPNCKAHTLRYYYRSYSNLGDYCCPNCGFARPKLDFTLTSIDELTPTGSRFTVDNTPMQLHIGGIYNIYNALAAFAVARLMKVEPTQIASQLSHNDQQVFGRQEVIHLGEKDVTMILVKNPVGLDQVLQMIKTDSQPFSLAVFLNANYADGIDTSWIWDGQFEQLPFDKIGAVLAGGEHYKDISFRLRVAGVPAAKFTEEADLAQGLDVIKRMPDQKVYILATYTAMLQLRKMLAEQGVIKGGME